MERAVKQGVPCAPTWVGRQAGKCGPPAAGLLLRLVWLHMLLPRARSLPCWLSAVSGVATGRLPTVLLLLLAVSSLPLQLLLLLILHADCHSGTTLQG